MFLAPVDCIFHDVTHEGQTANRVTLPEIEEIRMKGHAKMMAMMAQIAKKKGTGGDMKKSAKAAEYRAWKDRWKAVNEITAEENRRLTPADRLRQFFSLMEMARAMDWHTSTPEEDAVVRERWNRLRKAYGV